MSELGSSRAFFQEKESFPGKRLQPVGASPHLFGKLQQLKVAARRWDLAQPCESFAAWVLTFPGLSVLAFQRFILLLSGCVCKGNSAFSVYSLIGQLNSWKCIRQFTHYEKQTKIPQATNSGYLLSYLNIPEF